MSLVTQPMLQRQPNHTELRSMDSNIQILFRFGKSKRKVLQTTQMKLILLCVWADLAVLGSTKTALKFKYEI